MPEPEQSKRADDAETHRLGDPNAGPVVHQDQFRGHGTGQENDLTFSGVQPGERRIVRDRVRNRR